MDIIFQTLDLAESDMWAMLGATLLMCVDVVVGFTGSLINGEFQSSVMRVGLGHKLMEVFAVVLAVILQVLAEHVTGVPTFPSTVCVCAYLIVMEVGSIWENIVKVNPDLGKGSINDAIESIVKGDDGDES